MTNINRNSRNQLRKAIKLGLTAHTETHESCVDEYYSQAKAVFAAEGNFIQFSHNRALQCFRHMKESGNVLAIPMRMPDGACGATGIFMIEGHELNLWGWTHRREYRWYCPSELLVWSAMQKGLEAGWVTFDMAGGGEAKVKFGAVPDESN
jgi:lipid II:glycine glycyltransferase (peptidoglycan interpeptide bridge formation enzyme)